MRGRNTDYFYLEPEILEILRTSEVPMSALGVNFRINNKLEKVVDLNIIKQHLEELVKTDRLLRFEKDDIIHYKVNPRKKF